MCLYPTLRKNKRYVANKKNGGVIPSVPDARVTVIPTGCGNCIECRKQYARSWQVRLLEDIKHNKNAKFITLTFSNESICKLIKQNDLTRTTGYTLDNAIATKAVHLFRERWRKQYGKSIRHWLVTELGHNGTENIHLHGLLYTEQSYETIEKIWNYGYIWPRKDDRSKTYVNEKTINYITKYLTKRDEIHKEYKGIILTSKGIGADYLKTTNANNNKYNNNKTNETYKTSTGHKINLPTYWRNKIYTEEEKEQLWIQKLDKNERWICGQRISADNEKALYELLAFHRRRNAQLGYGNDEKNWDRIQYEKERRKLMYKQRIEQHEKKSNEKSWTAKDAIHKAPKTKN